MPSAWWSFDANHLSILSVVDNGDNTVNVTFSGASLASDWSVGWFSEVTQDATNGGASQVSANVVQFGAWGANSPMVGDAWSLINQPSNVAAGQSGTIA